MKKVNEKVVQLASWQPELNWKIQNSPGPVGADHHPHLDRQDYHHHPDQDHQDYHHYPHYHHNHPNHRYQHVTTISYFTEPNKPTEGSKVLVTVKDADGNRKYLKMINY